MTNSGTLLALMLAMAALGGNWFWNRQIRRAQIERLHRRVDGPEILKKHSKVFNEPQILKVTPRIYMALGFALANSMLIEGDDGVIIVDVTESVKSGERVFRAFRNITKKPVKAIVYTHNHGDHVYGVKAFIEDPEHPPEIWAHHGILEQFQRTYYTTGVSYKRAMRQFGALIPDRINSGIGLNLQADLDGMEASFVHPTKLLFGQERDIKVAGVDMKLVHIPGETSDQIGVWVPSEKAFLCADDIYKAFPNLYAIRGTPSRDLLDWSTSVDRMIALEPEFLVPSHTRPVQGREAIKELLTVYRDAIQYIHDQTIRYMNKGYLPDEITAVLQLPDHVRRHPYLQELYGTVEWSSKGVFNTYLGWFSGDPVDLSPLTPDETANRMIKLVGVDKLLAEAVSAFEKQDYQWALVLSSYVTRAEPDNVKAREVKSDALMALGSLQTSANGRNYYFTSALEEVDNAIKENNGVKKSRDAFIKEGPMQNIFKTLQVRFVAEKCGHFSKTVQFEFKDTRTTFTLQIRNSVVIVGDRPAANWDVKVLTSEAIWRDAVVSRLSTVTSLVSGDFKVEGGLMEFGKIMACFETD